MQVVHAAKPVVPRDRLLRLPDVEATTGCKKKHYLQAHEGRQVPAVRAHYCPHGGMA